MNDAMQKLYEERLAQIGAKKVSFKTLLDVTQIGLTALVERLLPRIVALENELAALKANGPNIADAYKGSWIIGGYKRGSLVTHQGGMFLALADTDDKPGTSDAWKLVTKAGRDGKDLRP